MVVVMKVVVVREQGCHYMLCDVMRKISGRGVIDSRFLVGV